MLYATPTFQVTTPRMINQNAPHELGRNREKMDAMLPLRVLVIHQPHIGFVNQSGGLQALTGAFSFHVSSREAMEFAINDGRKLVERCSIPVTLGSKQLSHVANRWPSGPVVLRL